MMLRHESSFQRQEGKKLTAVYQQSVETGLCNDPLGELDIKIERLLN